MIKLVIFDLDDTLISEADYVKSGYRVVSRYIEEKFKINSENVFNKLWSYFENKEKNTFNKLLDEYQISYSKDDIVELVNVYRNHKPTISFFDDVIPFLNELKSKNIYTGIISDGYINTQKNKLDALKAWNKFDYIILTDELGKEYWKPNPKAFEMMIQKFYLNPEEIIYIGDNPKKDFYIKNFMPIKTVRILRKKAIYIDAEYMQDIKEDVIIKDLFELNKSWIERISL